MGATFRPAATDATIKNNLVGTLCTAQLPNTFKILYTLYVLKKGNQGSSGTVKYKHKVNLILLYIDLFLYYISPFLFNSAVNRVSQSRALSIAVFSICLIYEKFARAGI